MKARPPLRRYGQALSLGIAGALLGAAPAWATGGGYERLTSAGDNVVKICNPASAPGVLTCRVGSLPGESGFNLVAARSQPIVVNGVTVGTQFERVWRKPGTTEHIFGVRVVMNAEQWDETGAAFNVNDVFRQVRNNNRVAIAYSTAGTGANKALQSAGRTFAGLNEEDEGERNNAWVDFRVDVNAAEGNANSPWLLTRTRAPEGYALQDFALRLLNSENPDVDQNSIYALGYQPVCTKERCEPVEEEEEEVAP